MKQFFIKFFSSKGFFYDKWNFDVSEAEGHLMHFLCNISLSANGVGIIVEWIHIEAHIGSD